jgi:NhaA family Na+:H+ antiporter
MRGWAIPSATDIAFSLAVLALLGNRVPSGLKLFLLTLAIIDDLGAIIIIALFYTTSLSPGMFLIAAIAVAVLFALNRWRVSSIPAYLLVGVVLWISVLKSGVHATLAGVLLAFFIPLRTTDEAGQSPLEKLEHDLHPTVAFGILPLFAFCNTGISFEGLSLDSFLQPVPVGIALGLFVGNQIGITGATWIAVRAGWGHLPDNVDWLHIYGVSMVCGIGFTMSLFIGSLAFEQVPIGYAAGEGMHVLELAGEADTNLSARVVDERLGILFGSLVSAVIGYLVLRFSLARRRASPNTDDLPELPRQ